MKSEKSRELKSSFNESGSCLGYNIMKRHRSDLANTQLCLAKEKLEMWPLRVIFPPSSFIVAAFDNLDYPYKSNF